MSLPSSIPRFADVPRLRADPLAYLRAAEATADGLVVLSEGESIFSRTPRCSGVVAAFGPAAIRSVLSDPEVFGMAVSVSECLSLPQHLVRLNAGLFSMCGEEHRNRQQLLTSLLARPSLRDYDEVIVHGWNAYREDLRPGQPTALLSEMRRLALSVAGPLFFGDDALELGRSIQTYFDLRRTLSGSPEHVGPEARRELIRLSRRLDQMLRNRLAALRERSREMHGGAHCLLARLAAMDVRPGERLTADELVAHGNVLFTSSSEPLAVALTWTLILLSQHEDIREALQHELTAAFGKGEVPGNLAEVEIPLLRAVIQESLRMLPPNAIMVRLTTKPTVVLRHELQARCEVVISPYVAHRGAQYVRPDTFDPSRWQNLKPPAYTYFPFGKGARYCIGRDLASRMLLSLLARLLHHFDVILAEDQDLDWKMDVTLMPSAEPIVNFLPLSPLRRTSRGGRLGGPVTVLAGLC